MQRSERQPAGARAPLAIELCSVRRWFRTGVLGTKRVEVLRDIDLAVAAGASLGLVGPNGSGKSTLLRLVAGVDEPSAGDVVVLGGDPRSGRVVRRVGYVPEESPFPPELSPRAALALIAGLHGVPRAERRDRAEAMLARVGLAGAARTRLGRFSRGMLRRFGLAQAFVHEPDVLLLDEPTAGLDALGFEVADLLLAEARARGATIVIASHVLGELTAHCDAIAVLIDGAVAARGAPDELSRALGPEAWTEIAVEGLGPGGLEALRARIDEIGATYRGAQPAQHDLIALYKRHGARARP